MTGCFQSFSVNERGRDLICADIHGHFSLLEKELENIGFDPSRDRLFSLGDLIDRGDESHLALQWLQRPWFQAIQGNHERMLINCVEQQSDTLRFQWFTWGGDWAEDLDDDELDEFYQAFRKLPVAIEIELRSGQQIGMLHAELPDKCDWTGIRRRLEELDPSDIEHNLMASDMLWEKRQAGMSQIEASKVEPVRNIDHVFHGHTIVTEITTIANRSFMDLGSYRTGMIGLIDAVEFLSNR